MPSPDCPTAVRGPQSWISAAKSSSSAAKTTTIIGFVTSDLQLGHRTYHRVAFQSLYTTSPETFSSDHPHATTRRSNLQQNLPRASCTISSILSLLPLSESSFSNLHSWKRIGLIGCFTCPHAPLEILCNISYAPHALHASPYCLLMSLADVICHVNPSCSPTDITY